MSWEVWTMKSKTSFFDPTLLKKNVGRFAPAWGLLTVFLFLNFPLPLMLRIRSRYGDLRVETLRTYLGETEAAGIVFAFGAAILFAALVFKYLHRTGSAYMMHAFPMTRRCQFLTNAVSGLLFWLIPVLIAVLCELGVLAATGFSQLGGQVWATAGRWCLAYLCFYGIAVFAMQLSGRTVIAIMSYGALNFMFMVLPLLILLLVGFYFRGFDYSVPDSFVYLSPLIAMLTGGSWYGTPMSDWVYVVYAALGLSLLALSQLLYKYRHVERAGDPMVFPWAKIAFRVLFTLCVALGLGWVFYGIFGLFRGDTDDGYLAFCLLGCFIGWFGSSMMIERTIKVFRRKKVWLGFAAFAAVLILVVVGLKYDLLGLQRRVPETDRVVSVELCTTGNPGDSETDCIVLTEPEDVDAVRSFHAKALQSSAVERSGRELFGYDGYGVHICYHLSNGGTLRRVYEPGLSDCEGLEALFSRPDVAEAYYARVLPEKFNWVTLGGFEDYYVDDDGTSNYLWKGELECKDNAALRGAILADAKAGRLPVVNFITRNSARIHSVPSSIGKDAFGFVGDLYLMFEIAEPAAGDLRFVTLPITPEATETLALFLP